MDSPRRSSSSTQPEEYSRPPPAPPPPQPTPRAWWECGWSLGTILSEIGNGDFGSELRCWLVGGVLERAAFKPVDDDDDNNEEDEEEEEEGWWCVAVVVVVDVADDPAAFPVMAL
jgi:hypothetical protein